VRVLLTRGKEDLPMSALLGSAGATLPFALSFALSRPEALVESKVMVAAAVSVCITDLLTLVFWRRASTGDSATTSVPAPPATPETTETTTTTTDEASPAPAAERQAAKEVS
jgi:hypothetical protein